MTISNIASSQMNNNMMRIATGNRINSAADDAAGLGISEVMNSQIRGLAQGTNNTMDMQNLVNTAEGGLSSINNNLQRMRELTLQASNSIYTSSDRQRIQSEIDQIRSEIDATASRTEFNNIRLLDGGFSGNTVSSPNGEGPMVTIRNMDSGMILGSGEFNVVSGEGADISRIERALSVVNSERSYLGAMSNRFDTTISSNQITNLNLAAARSRIADQDIGLAVMKLNQARAAEQTQMQMQQRQQQDEQQGIQILSMIG